jgi:lipid II:glycine glycyltransferase (peptidoglycan interpeptide bridge formation enzyme)
MSGQVASVEDQTGWDEFVAEHRDGGFLQSWRWGELKQRYGWRAIRLAIHGDTGFVAGAQVLVRTRNIWPGGPPVGLTYVPRGPLTDAQDDVMAIVHAAVELARDSGASFVRIEPPDTATADTLERCGFRASDQFVQIPRTAIVDLAMPEEDLLASFKAKMRYNIQLASRRGVEVRIGADDADFDAFMRLVEITSRREGFAIHDPAYYRDVWQTFQPDNGSLFIANIDGRALAALLVIGVGQTAAYVFGASSNTNRNLMASHAAQWAAIRWAKESGFAQYDLWGMANLRDPDDPMAGVHRFKLGFNPKLVTYPGAFDLVLHPVRAWLLTRGALHARKVIHGLRAGRWAAA